MDRLMCGLLILYLTTLTLEGPLRYLLAAAGVPNLLYLRDAVVACSILFLFLRSLLRDAIVDLSIAVPAALLVCHGAYALAIGIGIFPAAFGGKIYMYVLYGIAMWPLLRRRFGAMLMVASLMFAVETSGVLINFFVGQMPWEGLSYDTAFGTSSTTRVWWMTEGVLRLPGFARASFSAAIIIGITGLLAFAAWRSALARILIFVSGMAAIVLTTSKGMVIGFPLAIVLLVVLERRPLWDGHYFVGALCALCIGLPLSLLVWDWSSVVRTSELPEIVQSLFDRFTWMWPLAFDLLPDGPLALLGAGLGSIGAPQEYYGLSNRLSTADNMAVYLLVSFGVAGLLYCAYPAASLPRMKEAYPASVYRVLAAVVAVTYWYGLTTNIIEDSFFAVSLGICGGAACAAWGSRISRRKVKTSAAAFASGPANRASPGGL